MYIFTVFLRNFLGQTTTSRCEGFSTFRNLTPSPSSGCAGGLVPPARPEDGDGVISRNVEKPSHIDAADCPRKFH